MPLPKPLKAVQREIQPWHLRLPEEGIEGIEQYTGTLGRSEYETIAYKIVVVSKQAEKWMPLRYEHFSLNEAWMLKEMIQSGFLQYHREKDNFMLTERALQLIMEEYSGLH